MKTTKKRKVVKKDPPCYTKIIHIWVQKDAISYELDMDYLLKNDYQIIVHKKKGKQE